MSAASSGAGRRVRSKPARLDQLATGCPVFPKGVQTRRAPDRVPFRGEDHRAPRTSAVQVNCRGVPRVQLQALLRRRRARPHRKPVGLRLTRPSCTQGPSVSMTTGSAPDPGHESSDECRCQGSARARPSALTASPRRLRSNSPSHLNRTKAIRDSADSCGSIRALRFRSLRELARHMAVVGSRQRRNRLFAQSSGCPAIGNDQVITAMNLCALQGRRRGASSFRRSLRAACRRDITVPMGIRSVSPMAW